MKTLPNPTAMIISTLALLAIDLGSYCLYLSRGASIVPSIFAAAQTPPAILQVYRESWAAGHNEQNARIENEATDICLRLRCPHPYLGIESLDEPKEVWFFNSYTSAEDVKNVSDAYAGNRALVAALGGIAQRKSRINPEPVNVFAKYRADLSRGEAWALGTGRFFVIAMSNHTEPLPGTVFEADDGTFFTISAFHSRGEALAVAHRFGARVFAVRPRWSMPAAKWKQRDPGLWAHR